MQQKALEYLGEAFKSVTTSLGLNGAALAEQSQVAAESAETIRGLKEEYTELSAKKSKNS